MKTLDDLVEFLETVLGPDFDQDAAVARLGPIRRWVGARARIESTDSGLEDSVIDTLDGELFGVRTRPVVPLEVPWSDLESSLGPSVRDEPKLDEWGGPVPYRFEQGPTGTQGTVWLYLEDLGEAARIRALTVRRTMPRLT